MISCPCRHGNISYTISQHSLYGPESTLLLIDFTVLWCYFAWSNQTLAVSTLWAATVYLARHRKAYMITLAPAVFMAVVCVSYILFAPCTEGFGLSADLSLGTGVATAIVFICLFSGHIRRLSSQSINLKPTINHIMASFDFFTN